jgi:hypothetical protein
MISSARRFRFGGKKEAAGAAVAVMVVELWRLNSVCWFDGCFWGRSLSPVMRDGVKHFDDPSAVEPVCFEVERGWEAVLGDGHTLL